MMTAIDKSVLKADAYYRKPNPFLMNERGLDWDDRAPSRPTSPFMDSISQYSILHSKSDESSTLLSGRAFVVKSG